MNYNIGLLSLFSFLFAHTFCLSQQSQEWDTILEPDNSNSQFKRHAYFSNGEGYTYQEYSNFKIFKVTNNGGETWEQKATPKGELLENMFELFAPNSDMWYAMFAEAVKHRISVRAYNKTEDNWEHIATHSIPNQNLVLTSSEEVWMNAVSSNMMFGSVKGMDRTSFEILHHPFILTNGGRDITMLRDVISDNFKWVRDMAFADEQNGLLLIEDFAKNDILYQTKDSGKSWQKVAELSTNDFSDIEMPDEENYFVGMTDGKIYRTKDGGQNWFEIQTPSSNTIYEIAFANGNCGVLVDRSASDDYEIYRTTNGGELWVKDVVRADKNTIHSVTYIDCNTWFAITYGNVISNSDLPFNQNTSLEKTNYDFSLSLYPNPTSNYVCFNGGIADYRLYNLQGQELCSGTGSKISLQHLPVGDYVVILHFKGKMLRHKISVEH